jgi:hypothetical protein
MKTLFRAETLVETDVVETIFVSHVGKIEIYDGLVRFTLCEQVELHGHRGCIPRVCILRTLDSIARDGDIIKNALGARNQLAAISIGLGRAH